MIVVEFNSYKWNMSSSCQPRICYQFPRGVLLLRGVSQRERHSSGESVRHWLPTLAVPFAITGVRSINQLVISGGNQFCGAGAVNYSFLCYSSTLNHSGWAVIAGRRLFNSALWICTLKASISLPFSWDLSLPWGLFTLISIVNAPAGIIICPKQQLWPNHRNMQPSHHHHHHGPKLPTLHPTHCRGAQELGTFRGGGVRGRDQWWIYESYGL